MKTELQGTSKRREMSRITKKEMERKGWVTGPESGYAGEKETGK